jgi:hypothetical protein
MRDQNRDPGPKEQPPRKLSGKRTVPPGNLERDARPSCAHPPKGNRSR